MSIALRKQQIAVLLVLALFTILAITFVVLMATGHGTILHVFSDNGVMFPHP
jgi:hypothetical protein